MTHLRLLLILLAAALGGERAVPPGHQVLIAAAEQPNGGRSRRAGVAARSGPEGRFQTDVPKHAVDVILGRPTADSVTLSVLFYVDSKCRVAYGTRPDQLTFYTEVRTCRAGEPVEILLGSLKTDTQFYYELQSLAGNKTQSSGVAGRFHTQRPPGGAFTFVVQADSHLDGGTDPAMYARTLENALADEPDFCIDLGDTFMVDKYGDDYGASAKQYLAQRYYLGSLCRSAPLFLVLGNHDGEYGWRSGRGTDDIAAWSNEMRNRYFPNPLPSAFYSGNKAKGKRSGFLEDYYAWEWGDGLFIVLDPFWYTTRKPREDGDGWAWTLGETQYQWLQRTLQNSKAPYKFVFTHHLVGGSGRDARGGSEAAKYFEWGGCSADGSTGFKTMRPGWAEPIHDLLRDAHVTAVFHGHDHFFVKQELDGIVYQLVPQPGQPRSNAKRMAREYGYVNGDVFDGSGHLRVMISASRVTVDFMRTSQADGSSGQCISAEPVYSYAVDGARQR